MDAKKLHDYVSCQAIPIGSMGNFDPLVPRIAHALNQNVKPRIMYDVLKRFFDVTVASLGLIALFPFFILIACLIKLESKGPVFFTQTRVGRGFLLFRIIKFRSMHDGAGEIQLYVKDEATGQIRRPSALEDPRLTRVGIFLRRYSLDELPQLFNILFGEMSFVGPRPLIEDEALAIPTEALCRYAVRPGLSGLAQIKDRTSIHSADRFKNDVAYVKNRSLLLDVTIFMKSFGCFHNP